VRPMHPSICFLCNLFVPGVDPDNWRGKPICRAFPDGIPSEILDGGFDHRQPFGDETITFKPAEGVTEDEIDEWRRIVLEVQKMELLALIDRLDSHMDGYE
jgi:hypothetical protein